MDFEDGVSGRLLLLIVAVLLLVVVLGFLGLERMLLSEDGRTRLKPPVVDPIPNIEDDEIEEWEGLLLLFIKFSVLEYCGSLLLLLLLLLL